MKLLPVAVVLLSVGLVGSVAGNFLQRSQYSTSRPILTIAGEPLTKKEYFDQLEFQYGQPVLTRLFLRKLIQSSAKKAGVLATDQEVSERLVEIERRNPSSLEAAKTDPVKLTEFKEDVRTALSLENLRMKGVTASDAEVTAFYQKNQKAFELPHQLATTLVLAANSVDAATAKTLLAQKTPPEVIARRARLRVIGVGGFQMPGQMSPASQQRLQSTLQTMKTGDVAVLPIDGIFMAVRAEENRTAGVPPLEKIRPLAARMVRLAKAPTDGAVLAQLYKDAHVTFEVDRYSSWFNGLQQAADHIGAPGQAPAAKPAK